MITRVCLWNQNKYTFHHYTKKLSSYQENIIHRKLIWCLMQLHT